MSAQRRTGRQAAPSGATRAVAAPWRSRREVNGNRGVSGIVLLLVLALFVLLSRALGAAPAAPALSGLVVDGAGKPVAGAEVRLGTQTPARRGDELEQVFHERTTKDGRFRFAVVPHGRAGWLMVRAPEFAPSVRGVSLDPRTPSRIVLAPGAEARGTVVDEAGAPLAGAEVEVLSPLDLGFWFESLPPELREALYRRTQTEADGTFHVADLPPGGVGLRLWREGSLSATSGLPVPAGKGAVADFGRIVLATGARLEGRVTDPQGKPLAGIDVYRMAIAEELRQHPTWSEAWHLHPAVHTDAEGRFAVTGLPPAKGATLYFCSATHRSPSDLVSVKALPAPELAVTLEPKAPGVRDPRPGSLGSRDICPPSPAPEMAAQETAPTSGGSDTPPATSQPSPPADRPAATLTGRVFAGGKPLAGALVRALDLPRQFHETTSGPDGSYRLEGIGPGTLYVGASREGYDQELRTKPPEPVELKAGETRIDLTLARIPTPTLRGRVVDAQGRPLAGVLLAGGYSVHTATDGSFLVPLDPKVGWLFASRPGYDTWTYSGDLTHRRPAQLTIRLRRSRSPT